jgi:hypothetical protein
MKEPQASKILKKLQSQLSRWLPRAGKPMQVQLSTKDTAATLSASSVLRLIGLSVALTLNNEQHGKAHFSKPVVEALERVVTVVADFNESCDAIQAAMIQGVCALCCLCQDYDRKEEFQKLLNVLAGWLKFILEAFSKALLLASENSKSSRNSNTKSTSDLKKKETLLVTVLTRYECS